MRTISEKRGTTASRTSVRNGRTPAARGTDKSSRRIQFETILVPVDFSEPSKAALQYALELAKQFNARVHLLHVIEDITPPDFEAFPQILTRNELITAAKRKLVAFAQAGNHRLVPVYPEIRTGRIWEEITAAARDDETGLIVIPTRGETGLRRMLMGSVAERVVRHAPCPVLVLRGRKVDLLTLRTQTHNEKETGI